MHYIIIRIHSKYNKFNVIQYGYTALMMASEYGHKDIVSLLLSNTYIDVNKQTVVSIYTVCI